MIKELFDLLSRIEGHLEVIAKSVEDLAEYENYRKGKRDGKKAGF